MLLAQKNQIIVIVSLFKGKRDVASRAINLTSHDMGDLGEKNRIVYIGLRMNKDFAATRKGTAVSRP